MRALFVVAVTRLGLWFLPLKTVLKVAGAVRKSSSARADTSAATLAWAVAASSRLIPRASCLTQALAAHSIFTRHGLDSEVRIGVARNATGIFEAHAWLEHQGQVILGDRDDLSRYLPLPSLELISTSRFSQPR